MQLKKILLTSLLIHSTLASANYGFSGSCLSQGQWTQKAKQLSHDIKETLNQFKDNPDCAGLGSLYAGVKISENLYEEESKKDAQTKQELNSLDNFIRNGEGSSKGASLLLGKIIDSGMPSKKIEQEQRSSALNEGLRSLGQFFDKLPEYDSCLMANFGIVNPLLDYSVKMLTNYSDSTDGTPQMFAETLNKFSQMMRTRFFTSSIEKLDDMELTNSISCLLEAATENYCRVKDAYEMLEMSDKETELFNAQVISPEDYNPLEGYFMLTREAVIVSDWLQNVMFGVYPRTIADSNQKNKVIENVNEFLMDVNSVYGYYSNSSLEFEALVTEESRKNHLLELVKGLTGFMVGNSSFGSSSRRGDINFFIRSKLAEKIPFFLIGIDDVPDAVASNNEGRYVMDQWLYMQQGGKFLPEFDNPRELLTLVGNQLKDLVKLASENASSYLRKRLIVDKQNLVDQSIVSQTISSYDALKRISKYLNKLIDRASYSNDISFYGMVSSLRETDEQIRSILDLYDRYFKESKELLHMKDLKEIKEHRNKLSETAMEIIAVVYTNFNVILQRDTYILNRLETYVKYDYMFYTKQNENLTDYQRDLLIVSGKQLVSIFGDAVSDNPARVKLDLANAQVMNKTSLLALEEVFRDTLLNSIARYNRIQNSKGDGFIAFVWDFEKRLVHDSFGKESQKEKVLASLYKKQGTYVERKDELGTPVFNPAKWVYRSIMNPDRYKFTGRIFERADYSTDDVYGSLAALKSKLCLQSLSFTNYYEYYHLCEDSKLDGIENRSDKDLSVSYNELVLPQTESDYFGGSSNNKNTEFKEAKEESICSLRNYHRKNHAFWLLETMTK